MEKYFSKKYFFTVVIAKSSERKIKMRFSFFLTVYWTPTTLLFHGWM